MIAEIADLPGVLPTDPRATKPSPRAGLWPAVLAERLEHAEAPAELLDVSSRRVSSWPASKAPPWRPSSVGWQLKRQSGSHRTLTRPGWPDVAFAFHDDEELGPTMLARISKKTGLRPEDLSCSSPPSARSARLYGARQFVDRVQGTCVW
jgi:predicted RNA binding protein YcfA (HicA-like mRNA interferase family)